ncbi:MAG: hypothetical protein JW891_02065 [Candidatus Lokiarchaeota archaeon]|nr:hypothetical protein [Candidatus Lokiarchaeota archaeon]
MNISPLSHLSGITAVIGVSFSFVLTSMILKKAIKDRSKMMLYFAIAAVIMSEPWWPYYFGYIYWLATQNIATYDFYIIMANLLTPFAMIAWIQIYAQIISPKKKRIFLIFSLIYSIIYWIYLFSALYWLPGAPVHELLGFIDLPYHPFDIIYTGYILFFHSFNLLFTLTTGFHFARNTMELEGKRYKIQGIFMLLGWTSYCVSSAIDASFQLNEVALVPIRVIVSLSGLFFYIGFIFPVWIRKLFHIQDELIESR